MLLNRVRMRAACECADYGEITIEFGWFASACGGCRTTVNLKQWDIKPEINSALNDKGKLWENIIFSLHLRICN